MMMSGDKQRELSIAGGGKYVYLGLHPPCKFFLQKKK
jgi:hypothetical protein